MLLMVYHCNWLQAMGRNLFQQNLHSFFYHSVSNGLAERFVRTLKDAMEAGETVSVDTS